MKKTIGLYLMIVVLIFSMTAFVYGDDEKASATPYGFVKFDAIYETGAGSHGNFAIWAKDPGENDSLWHLTANHTRIGLNLQGISFGTFKVTGKVEIDFYGGGAENKANPMMRHAFLKVSDGSLSFIAGQTWDIICPLNPPTLNYPVAWGAGNIGYRRPQLRIQKVVTTGNSVITMEAGIFRTIMSDFNNDGIDDGLAGGFPTVQARLAAKFSLGGSASIQLGVSGHTGKSKGDVEYTTDSINGDLLLVISPRFKILAEYFSGKNLGAFLGGIVQNVNPGSEEEIKAKGFFVCAVANPTAKLQLAAGYSMDDPDDDTLRTAYRSKNTSFFGNFLISFSKSFKIGFEVSNWVTDYIGRDQQKTTRFQNSWILSF